MKKTPFLCGAAEQVDLLDSSQLSDVLDSGSNVGGRNAQTAVQVDAMGGDEPGLNEEHHEPKCGDEAVQLEQGRERKRIERRP